METAEEEAAPVARRVNTFKFKGFNEHKARIKSAILRNQLFSLQLHEDAETKCAAVIEKWTELNSTSCFTEFKRNVGVFVQSLEILLLHKDDVIEAFKQAAEEAPVDSLQPLLEFGVALSMDISEEMFDHVEDVVQLYERLLERYSLHAEALEALFTNLSYTFYALRRQLRRSAERVLRLCLPLLRSDRRSHVAEFAAETLAFVLRKLPAASVASVAELLRQCVDADATLTEGVAALCFYWLRGACGTLHSQHKLAHPQLLLRLSSGADSYADCLCRLHTRLLRHLNSPTAAEPLWRLLLDYSQQLINNANEAEVGKLCRLLLAALEQQRRPQPEADWLQLLQRLCRAAWCRPVCRLLAAFVHRSPAAGRLSAFRFVLNELAEVGLDDRLQFVDEAMRLGDCSREALACLVPLCADTLRRCRPAGADTGPARLLHFLSEFCIRHRPLPAEEFVLLTDEQRFIDFSAFDMEAEFCGHVERLLASADASRGHEAALSSALLPWLRFRNSQPANWRNVQRQLLRLLTAAADSLAPDSATACWYSVLHCTNALLQLRPPAKELAPLVSSLLLRPRLDCPLLLKSLDFACSYAEATGQRLEMSGDYSAQYQLLMSQLSAGGHSLRLHSLRLMRFLLSNSLVACLPGCQLQLQLVDSCLGAQQLPAGIQHQREAQRCLERLAYERLRSGDTDDGEDGERVAEAGSELCSQYLLGVLRVQFTPAWPVAARLLATHASAAHFWPRLSRQLEAAGEAAVADQATATEDAGAAGEEADEEAGQEAGSEEAMDCEAAAGSEQLEADSRRLVLGISNEKLERRDNGAFQLQLWKMLQQIPAALVASKTSFISPSLLSSLELQFTLPGGDGCTVRRRCQAALVAALEVYAGMRRAVKCAHSHAELRRWCYELLQCNAAPVQLAALRCLLAFGDKLLAKHSDFLLRAADEKSTKEALVGGFESESDEERQLVNAVLLRLLLGRLRAHTRRRQCQQLAFSYLGRCDQRERELFYSLLFQPFRQLSLASVQSAPVDSAHVGRLQAAMKSLQSIFANLSASLQPDEVCRLYELVLCLNAVLLRLLGNDSVVGNASQLRAYRQLCHRVVAEFFELDSTQHLAQMLTKELIQATYDICVEPQLGRLPTEGIYSPGVALRLLRTWSSDTQFDWLLQDGRAVGQLAELLANHRACSEEVLLCLMTIFNNLTARFELVRPAAARLVEFVTSRVGDVASRKVAKKKQAAKTVDSELHVGVLRLLSSLVEQGAYSGAGCHQLARSLLRLLVGQRRSPAEEFEARLLSTLLTLLRHTERRCPELFLKAFGLFSKLTHRASRQILCEMAEVAVDKLQLQEQPLALVARELNAWDRRHVELADFERRQTAYALATGLVTGVADWQQLQAALETIVVAVHCSLHTLATIADAPLRLLATDFLQALLCRLSALAAADCGQELVAAAITDRLLWHSVWPAIGQGIRMDEARRGDYLLLLGRTVSEFRSHPKLRSLAKLLPSDSDEEKEDNFFDNVRSVSSARVVRGLRQLIAHLSSGQCDTPPELVHAYLLPLPMHYLTLGRQAANLRRSLAEASLELVTCICRRLSWPQYRQLLRNCLQSLEAGGSDQKLTIRLAVAALAGFCEAHGQGEETVVAFMTSGVCPGLERHLSRSKTAHEKHRLAPKGFADSDQVFQVQVAIALTQLLVKLPTSALEQRLPKVLFRIGDFLRSREHAVRKEAGATLVQICKLLGPQYLLFVARELSLLLPRGYMRHVLAHTLHIVIREMHAASLLPCGCLDGDLLKLLCDIYLDELFGDMAKEKEVAALVKKLPEAKRLHAYAVFHRVGCLLGVDGLSQLLERLSAQCRQVRSAKGVRKAERLFDQLQRRDSLLASSQLGVGHLLTAAYMLCTQSVAIAKESSSSSEYSASKPPTEESKKLLEERQDILLLQAEPARGTARPRDSGQLASYHVTLRFGLRLLAGVLRLRPAQGDGQTGRATDRGRQEQCPTVGQLEPFVPPLLECLDSQHSSVLTAAIRCLDRLAPLGLPALKAASAVVSKRVLALFNEQTLLWSTAGQQPTELHQTLHKTLAALIRHDCLPAQDLVTVMDYVALDLDSAHRVSFAFPLLKAILARRLNPAPRRRHELDTNDKDHASLASVMISLRHLVVRSTVDSVRSQARDCLLVYLRDYRLSPGVVRKFVDFFVVQLDYTEDAGRSSVAEMLGLIVHGLDERWLRTLCDLLFLKLLVAMDNEQSVEIRAKLNDCLLNLVAKVDESKRSELQGWTVRMLASGKWTPRRLGLMSALLFLDQPATKELQDALLQLLAELSAEKEEIDDEADAASDQVTYRCVDAIGRVQQACPQLPLAEAWPPLRRLLGHRFPWVRRRCLQLFLQRLDSDDAWRPSLAELRQLTLAGLDQLKSAHLNEEWADDIARLMVHVCCMAHRLLGDGATANGEEAPANGHADNAEGDGFSADWLLQRLGRESLFELNRLKPSTIRRRLALKVFAGVCAFLQAGVQSYLRRILIVTSRELRQRSRPAVGGEELLELTHSLLDKCRAAVGESALAASLAEIERLRSGRRAAKANELATAAVTQPELFAQRKRRKQRKKLEAAKARVKRFKLARGAAA